MQKRATNLESYQSASSAKPNNAPWIIFDGDNTLWNVEVLYDNARSALCKMLASIHVTENDVWMYQQQRDKELHKTFGYSPERFPQSFVDTLLHFEKVADADRIRGVRNLANRVFEEKACLAEGVEEVLSVLSTNYRLALLTAGDESVQMRRLEHFGYRHLFEWVTVVPHKSPTVLQNLVQLHSIDVSLAWMVGDSIRSDMIPAAKVGMNTVWITAPNWTLVEHDGHDLPSDTHQVTTLGELLEIFETKSNFT